MGPNSKSRLKEAKSRDGKAIVATVTASGEVDRAGLEACDYLLSQASENIAGAVVDLTQATYIDYRAATILVARRRVLKARGHELAVAAGRSEVRNIIRASVGAEIPVFVSVDEATAYVRGEGDVVAASSSDRQTKRSRSERNARPG